MSKQYFYSYHIYKNGIKSSFGHGSTSVDDDSMSGYSDTLDTITKAVDDNSAVVHIIAFNRIDA